MEKQSRPQIGRECKVLADHKPLCTLVFKKIFPYDYVIDIPLHAYYRIDFVVEMQNTGKINGYFNNM